MLRVRLGPDGPARRRRALDDLVQVHGLAFAPWVNRQSKIVRSFRADAVAADGPASRRAA
jgi:hypothetical protein